MIGAHLSILVQLVVGQLDLLEGHDLLPQLLPGVGTVRMWIQPPRRGRVGLAGHQPRGAVVGVAVALVVAGNNVQHDVVLAVRPEIREAASDSRKHPPAKNESRSGKIRYKGENCLTHSHATLTCLYNVQYIQCAVQLLWQGRQVTKMRGEKWRAE